MQSTISIAAMILGAAAIVLGTVGIGACKTTSELIDTKVRSTDDRLAFRMIHPTHPAPAVRPSPGSPPRARVADPPAPRTERTG
jgi:hypothetical protein